MESWDLNFVLNQVIDGVATGGIYGIFAMALVFIYRSTKVLNFGQAEMATLSTYLVFLFHQKVPFFTAIALALICSFIVGAAIYWGVLERISKRASLNTELNELIVTIGVFTMTNSLVRYFFGNDIQTIPSMFPEDNVTLGEIIVTYQSLGVIAVTVVLALLLFFFFQFTKTGLAMKAVSENRLAARLKGIRTIWMLTLAWGMAAVVGAIAGILIAPIVSLSPGMMFPVFLYGFAAAVIGGLDSTFGALVGGMIVGVTENLAGAYEPIGSELKLVAVFVVLTIVLVIRPRGLFTKREVRKV